MQESKDYTLVSQGRSYLSGVLIETVEMFYLLRHLSDLIANYVVSSYVQPQALGLFQQYIIKRKKKVIVWRLSIIGSVP